MAGKKSKNDLYVVLREPHHHYRPEATAKLLEHVDEARVGALADQLAGYINTNLPDAIERRSGIADYRTNPYVMLTSASVMKLSDPIRFADFLFNNKLYMGLETSFGKSIEAAFVGQYPIGQERKWIDPPEKVAEHEALAGLSRQERARKRTDSVWREIDKSCVVGKRRYLVSIKSGPNCINDTQVDGMKAAIASKHGEWMRQTKQTYPGVTHLDIVVGITYGTDRSTNNKENQILVKLLEHGFVEKDRRNEPGVLRDEASEKVRVYRRIGQDFWAFIGNPGKPNDTAFVFLEVLIALTRALTHGVTDNAVEERLNRKIDELASALRGLKFPRKSLPTWVSEAITEDALFWLATAITAFYDEGI